MALSSARLAPDQLNDLRSCYEGKESITESQEPLLLKSTRRFVLFPIRYPAIWHAYKHIQSLFWTIEEIKLQPDLLHWKTCLSSDDHNLISRILALLVAPNRMAARKIIASLADDVQVAEARSFYGFQLMMDNIHYEAYSRLMTSFMEECHTQVDTILTVNTTAYHTRRAEWISKWIESAQSSFAERLVTCAAMQSILFSASYAALCWLKTRGVMPGLTSYNELISRDKACHTSFSCLLFQHLERRPHRLVVQQIVKEAVEMEQNLVTDSLPVAVVGLSPVLVSQYVKFVADDLLRSLSCDVLYNAKNPFDFMLESRVYQPEILSPKPSAARLVSPPLGVFCVDEEF